MTATDELRRLLDERGVEWTYSVGPFLQTNWEVGDVVWHAKELERGFDVSTRYVTPAQAVEATLGRGECRNVHEPPNSTQFWSCPHFKCSECGATHISVEYVYYCPNCGRKVVDD